MLPDDLVTPERVAGLTALLGSAVVKATAVLLLGSVCVLLARSASAATRHLIWVLTLGGASTAGITGTAWITGAACPTADAGATCLTTTCGS